MKEFLDFEIKADRAKLRGDKSTYFTMRHRKNADMAIMFSLPEKIDVRRIPVLVTFLFKTWAKKYREKTLKKLTLGQKSFYGALVKFHKKEGRAPTYSEMLSFTTVNGKNARSKGTPYHYVETLKRCGWVWVDKQGYVIPIDISAPEMID